jgi:hypothetical protein
MRLTPLLLLAALTAPAAAHAQGWTSFPYPDDGFAVQFPAQPTVAATTVSTPAKLAGPARVISLKDEAVTYTVTVIDLSGSAIAQPEAIGEAEKALGAKGVVKTALDARINQQFGRELSIDEADGGKLVAAIFFANHKLYELTGVAAPPNAQGASSSLIRFQQSLQFTGPGGGGFGGRRGGGGPDGGFGPPRGGGAQAAAACAGKKAGDKVQLDTPNGQVSATSTLLARPDQPPGGGPGGGFGGPRPPRD